MRPVTRNFVLLVALVLAGLLALGAVPSTLGSGPSYHLTLSPVDGEVAATNGTTTATNGTATAANVSDLSGQRYPYLASALESPDNRSDGYQRGKYGLKESFTHSPFDEVDALRQQYPDARTESGVLVEYKGARYLVTITR